MLKRIVIKKWESHGGNKYLLECNFCHKHFQIDGFIFNGGQGKFCSSKCWYDFRRNKPRQDKVTWGNKISFGKKGKYLGDKHPNWKGGRVFDNGYTTIYSPNHPHPNIIKGITKYVYEHRLIMEKKIGRYLTKNERIHHLNGIRTDNRIENLILLPTTSEHMKLHNNLRKKNTVG